MNDSQKDKIKVKVEKKSKCKIELEVETGPNIVEEAQKQAIKDVKKEVSIPGFRKGKAPDKLIFQKYPEAIKEKLEKKIADISFITAQRQEKLPRITADSRIVFNMKEYSFEKGAKLSFSYETEPEVPTIDPKAFKIKKEEEPKVSEKEIKEAIRQIRFFHAKWNEVDRPIKENDYIIIDLDSVEADPPQRVFSDTRFEVSDVGMATWMKKLILGKKANDTIKGISKPDEIASSEEKEKFEPKKVLITIKKIEQADLPKLDDEFAKKVGVKSIDEMNESIKKMLTQQKLSKHNQENRRKVNEFLLNTYEFEVPESMIKTEIEYRRNSYLKNPKFKKQFETMSDKEKKEFEKELLDYSEKAIRIFYISKKIVNDFKIKITEEEIKQEASNILYKELGQKPDPKNLPKDIYALAISRLVLIKAEDYILDQSLEN